MSRNPQFVPGRQTVVFVFLDGLGIGSSDPAANPIARLEEGIFPFGEGDYWDLPCHGIARKADAQLDMPGLPQSATGQTTLFTGINAAKIIGRHLPGFPTPKLKRIIAANSILRQIQSKGLKAAFANCYSPRFFEKRPRWISVTTTMCENSQVRLRTLDDLQKGRGLFFDLTNRLLRDRGLEIPLFTPQDAAKSLIRLSQDYSFCLYENFLPDLIGHRWEISEAVDYLGRLEQFLLALVKQVNPDRCSVLVTSDHGNLEDMSVRTHTCNPVPVLVWGKLQQEFLEEMTPISLCDITPKIVRFLTQS